jgi:hypothetical protein
MHHKTSYKCISLSDFKETATFSFDFCVNNYGELPFYCTIFVYSGFLGGSYDSQATNKSMLEGGEFSHRIGSVFFWLPGSHI